jgi:hypothetical protein
VVFVEDADEDASSPYGPVDLYGDVRVASNVELNVPSRSRTSNRNDAARSPRFMIRFRAC